MSVHTPNEEAIFKAAIKLPTPQERDEYVRQNCQDDPELLARVQRLLRYQQEDASFLESPPYAFDVNQLNTEGPGSQIGPYILREQIGEGGMGIVYVAEQTEPVKRKVALKVVKPGMDSREIIARFEVERQALAVMDHPHIARVLDAGMTEAGRSYFVMELVRGIAITEYCDQARLTPRERLELFIDVCEAVQHAHQKGIIHRDIKPSNVLVTQIDGRPVVKVIDFGLAKATSGQPLTDSTLYTGFMQLLGTPVYMSPEQTGLSGSDVDTRSDIYSLGIVLYELLTGSTPLMRSEVRSVSHDEVCRRIREREAPRPSARISTLRDAQRSTVAHQRRVDIRSLCHILKGDLDRVVLKSIEKDRTRRYETATALAQDVRRYLNHEPVTAVPPRVSYLVRTALRRHRATITTAACFLLLLLVGTVVSTVFAVQSRREARNANTQSSRAERALLAERQASQTLAAQRDQARRLRDQAEQERQRALAMLYVNDIRYLYTMSRDADIQRFDLLTKLSSWAPVDGDVDRRGWEWYFLSSTSSNAHRYLHRDAVRLGAIASHSGSRLMASVSRATSGSLLSIWDVDAERTVFNACAHEVEGTAIAWSFSGDLIVTGSHTGELKFWKVDPERAAARPWRTVQEHTSQVSYLAFSPDGRLLVSTSHDQRAIVWDAASATKVCVFAGHGHEVENANWHPEGHTVVSVNQSGGEICFWDPMTGRENAPRISDEGAGWAVWHPTGERLATVQSTWPMGKLTIRDGKTHTPIFERTLPHIQSAFWHPNNKMFVTQHSSDSLQIWEQETDLTPKTVLQGHTGVGVGRGIPIGDQLATASGDHTIRIWNVNREHSQSISSDGPVAMGAWSPDGERLAYLSDGRVHVLSSRDGKTSIVIQDDTAVEAFDWSPDAQRIATWDFREVSLWDTETGGRLMSFETDHDSPNWTGARTVDWHPTDDRLITAVYDNANVWDTLRGKKLQQHRGGSGFEGLARWSPDGSEFVLAHPESSWTVVVRGAEEEKLPGSGYYEWSPDGNRFIVGYAGGVIRSAKDGAVLVNLNSSHARGTVTAVAWHPDGMRVATATDLGTVSIFSAESGQELLTLREHTGPVQWMGFSPDGKRLASAGDDNKVQVWDATAGYQRGRSPWLLDRRKTLDPAETVGAGEWLSRARMHASAGHWDQAATHFERASEQPGDEASAWFEAGEWIVGPFPGDLETRYPPEDLVQFDPKKSIPGGPQLPLEEKLHWRPADPEFRQGARIPGVANGQSAYAIARVYAPRKSYVACLSGASRFDIYRIWHNGKLIHEQSFVSGRVPDEAYVPVTLEPGWHTFLIKVLNVEFREEFFGVYFRLADNPMFLAHAYERMEDSNAAMSLLDEALTKYPGDADLLLVRALTHSRLGNSAAVEEDFQRAESMLGKDRLALKYFDFAGPKLTETLQDALRAMPDNLILRAFRADRLAGDGKWSGALEDELLLAQHQQYQHRTESLALLLAVSGREEQYGRQRDVLLERIAAGAPEQDVGVGGQHQMFACLAMPTTAEDIQKIDAVYQWYHTWPVYLLSDPHGRVQKWLEGLLAYRRGDHEEAIELLSEAAKYDPDLLSEPWMHRSALSRSATCNAYLAIALHRVGRNDEARAALQLAKDSPHNDRIYAQIAIREATGVVGE